MLNDLNYCVYRYIDINDNIVKYIGIVNQGTLPNRHKTHQREDWYKEGTYLCQYIQLNNQSETEALESHLITYYGTDQYYNKAKAGWGLNSFIQTPNEEEWKDLEYNTVEAWMDGFNYSARFRKGKKDDSFSADEILERLRDLNKILKIMKFKEEMVALNCSN
jgi:hypothetical protein